MRGLNALLHQKKNKRKEDLIMNTRQQIAKELEKVIKKFENTTNEKRAFWQDFDDTNYIDVNHDLSIMIIEGINDKVHITVELNCENDIDDKAEDAFCDFKNFVKSICQSYKPFYDYTEYLCNNNIELSIGYDYDC